MIQTSSIVSATLGLHLVLGTGKLLISSPSKGRRLSWPEHTVGYATCSGPGERCIDAGMVLCH